MTTSTTMTSTTTSTGTVGGMSCSSCSSSTGDGDGAAAIPRSHTFCENTISSPVEEHNSLQVLAGLWEAVCEDEHDNNSDYLTTSTSTLTFLLSRRQMFQLHKFGAYGVDTVSCATDGVVARMTHSGLYVVRSLLASAYCHHAGFFCYMTTTQNKKSTSKTTSTATKTFPKTAQSLIQGLNFALSTAACDVLLTPNAGGDSVVSECLSVELLSRMLFSNDTALVATEMDAKYYPSGGSMTDYVIRWGQAANVSVSVTRVFDGATFADAARILTKKLQGITFARRSLFAPVRGRDCSWVLHLFVPNGRVAKLVKRAWSKVDAKARGGVVVIVTIWNEPALYERTY
ncbi:UNVERIFIED_CONTAM: hypothetical protein HDU68_011522 [Siphonaria sp. JEL0065]|nr:hypothetical protein HDU68_011522 [Siphonaria sp. JEL0065]